ncbi:hypothetical protein C1645_736591 [Glomus cerebriforme]|uniref:Uncharacterized protein n=1 Tax=Glomus cerebriforme TaxID=658196 RepID=A0A397T0Y1_9GLOM|nr:hypothetical protein C1645_736591 [Glomus cerebriforme]
MTSNTINKFVQSEILENQLYEVLLYKKMDVLAIQERLAERKLGINDNANQTALNQSMKAEILDYALDDYTSKLLFDLVEKIISIEEDLETDGHSMLIILHRYRKDLMDVSIGEFSLREKYHLLLYLEEDISMIQNYLGIVGYTDEEMINEEAEKDVRAYIQKFRRSKCGNTEIHQ